MSISSELIYKKFRYCIIMDLNMIRAHLHVWLDEDYRLSKNSYISIFKIIKLK